jgi:quinol monooxygenase YgiN
VSENIFFVFELAIKTDDEQALDDLVKEMIDFTHTNEPGALNYEWFIDGDRDACHIYERYADSSALMKHIENFGANFAGRFMSLLEPSRLHVYGKVDGAAKAALAGIGATFFGPLDGFSR